MTRFKTFRDRFLRELDEVLGRNERCYSDPEKFFDEMMKVFEVFDQHHSNSLAKMIGALLALKLTRIALNPEHYDSWLDLAGYAALGAYLCADPEQSEKDH
ncbi:MAG: DUF6378 domain-containing protein [Candidatus Caldarchaeum sp.]